MGPQRAGREAFPTAPVGDAGPTNDPVIEAYKRDIDRTLLRESLHRTPTERLRCLVALQRFARELRRAGRQIAGH